MTYFIPEDYVFPKLHKEVVRAVMKPMNGYREHWNSVDFSNIDERDLIDLIDYWIGDLTVLDQEMDRVQFVNRKKRTIVFNADNFSADVISGWTHLCFIKSPFDRTQVHWAQPIPLTAYKIDKGDMTLSHLFCLWYNDNLPLVPLEVPLGHVEQKKKDKKFIQLVKLFHRMEYNDPAKGWPSRGDRSWYQYSPLPGDKIHPALLV